MSLKYIPSTHNNHPIVAPHYSFILIICLLFLFSLSPHSVYAINDITIDGALGDWSDENGFFTDSYTDSTPARTNITQFGLAVLNNGVNPESLALLAVTDSYGDGGNMTGDSHKSVFILTSGANTYEIVVTIQNGCDAINEVTIATNGGTPMATTAYTSIAIGIITSPVYAPAPENDTTNDCAVEMEFPISTLPNLDVDLDGELLDESFETVFISRQSGGVGSNTDLDDVGGLTPTAVTNMTPQITSNNRNQNQIVIITILMLISTTYILRRKATHLT